MHRPLTLLVVTILLAACASSPADEFGRFSVQVNAPPNFIANKDGPITAIVNGMVEINAVAGTVCLTLTGLRFSAASLEAPGAETIGPFESTQARAGDICIIDIEHDQLASVLNDWPDYSLVVALPSGETAQASLQHLDQSG